MKNPIAFLIVLCALNFNCLAQQEKQAEVIGQIWFGSGFGKDETFDSTDFRVNGVQIYKDYVLYSIPNLGLANGGFMLLRVKDRVCAITEEREIFYIGKYRKNKLEINMFYQKKQYDFMIDLALGKYLVFDFNWRNGTIEVTQSKTEPGFE